MFNRGQGSACDQGQRSACGRGQGSSLTEKRDGLSGSMPRPARLHVCVAVRGVSAKGRAHKIDCHS